MMHIIYPGTFDPVTLGHVDLVQRALCCFGDVLIAVAADTNKTALFSVSDRVALCEQAFADEPRVNVIAFDGLLVECAKAHNINVILRGVRDSVDFDYETRLAGMNQLLDSSIETLFMKASPKWQSVSSGFVKEVKRLGGDVSAYVPPAVREAAWPS
jgi:pantetheine-phosphate adenylyltransferase